VMSATTMHASMAAAMTSFMTPAMAAVSQCPGRI
jgi:hypothetical protein